MPERDQLQYDYLVIGAGPAGLACALRLKQLKSDASVAVLEKGSTVGAHALSGAVMEPEPLDALQPGWRARYSGFAVEAQHDEFRFLTRRRAIALPLPPPMRNHGSDRLARTAHRLAGIAGRERRYRCVSGFAAAAVLRAADGAVSGVQVGDMGVNKDGTPGSNYAPAARRFLPARRSSPRAAAVP